MAHDLIIRNGQVIDGTGAPATAADVAIDGDRITAIGDLADAASTDEIDAAGQVVTPGFVDLHTHMDAQIGWDPYMTSSSWHGVTTVLMGNCGVTFAPVAPDNRSYLAEMMESVEDIPREAILDGIPWDWETFPQYLDSVERMDPALNVVGLVGHCAVRYHVMGERSLSETEEPTAAELGQMRDIAAESVAGGAVGYSTSRLLGHKVPDGRCVPGTFSSVDEYLAIADGMNDAGGGLFQAVLDFDTKAGHEFELLKAMAERAGDVLFSSGVGTSTSGDDMRVVDMWNHFLTDINDAAGHITGICMTRPSGTLMGLYQVPPIAGKAWGAVMALPTHAERARGTARSVDPGRTPDRRRGQGSLVRRQPRLPDGHRRAARLQHRHASLRRRSGGGGGRLPGRLGHRPTDRERRARDVQRVVLQPPPRGARPVPPARRHRPRPG